MNVLVAGWFSGLTALETLSLSSNRLSVVPPGVFQPLGALKLLLLSRCGRVCDSHTLSRE
jgi:hypothetical protein